MRKVSMKGRRGKSDASDSESENNGVDANVAREQETEAKSDNSDDQMPLAKRSAGSANNTPSRKRNSRSSRGKINYGNDNDEKGGDEDELERENGKASSSSKKRKTEKSVEKQSDEDLDEYEVEKIIAQRTIKGRRQFLIRWKGFDEDSDTWEQEKDLNCQQLIEEFLAESEDNIKAEVAEKTNSKTKGKAKKKANHKKSKTAETSNDENDKDPEQEYEVERIIDVHFKKNKSRDFLIRWKGFSSRDDTWEPEEHLNCPDLINKFMEKVEKAKSADPKELRANRKHTERYVTHVHGKRHSRRNVDKQRVIYHDD